MRIQSMQVEHYGQYENFQLTEEQLSTPITVIYGANESGKSTLHTFIRGILFGFRPRGNLQHSYLTSQTVGTLTLSEAEGQSFQIMRSCPPKNGKVTIFQGHRQEEGEAALQHKLGGLTATLFQNIFCFSHQELQNIDTLQGEEIAAYLHSAAMGAGGLSLLDVEKRLLKQQELLFKPRAVNPQLNQLLSELEQQQQEMRELHRKIGEYQPVQTQLQQARKVQEANRKHRSLLEKERTLIEYVQQAVMLLQKIKQLKAMLAGLRRTPLPFLNYEAELYNLRLESAVIREKEQERTRLEIQHMQLAEQITHGLERLGEGWSMERIERTQLSIPVQEELLQVMQELEERERKIQLLVEKVEEKQEAARRAEQKWKEVSANQHVLQSEQTSVRASRGTSGSRFKRRALLWLSSAGLSVLLLLISWFQGQGGIGLVLGGAILAFAIFFTFWGQEGAVEKEERNAYRNMQQDLLAQQNRLLASTKQEAEQCSKEVERLQEKLDAERHDQQKLRIQTEQLLKEWGLESLSRLTGLQSFFQQLEQTQQQVLQSRRLAHRLQELEQDILSWCKAVTDIAEALEMTGHGRQVGPQAILEQLLLRVDEELETQNKARELHSNLVQLQHEYEEMIVQIQMIQGKYIREKKDKKLELHIEGQAACFPDIYEDHEARGDHEDHEARVGHQDHAEELNESVAASVFFDFLGSRILSKEELQLWINQVSKAEVEEKSQELADQYANIFEQMEQQALVIGHLQQKLKQLEADDSLVSLQHDFEQKKALFREKAKLWSAYAVARTLSAQTRQIYEEERQPGVLKQASHFFASFTQGRYQQVIVPFGEKELVVIDHNGKRWNSDVLSKGTKEQLYLAMRFALVKEYEKQAVLPVILDDPFVHFDALRLRQVFQGMLELGRTHQLILFTCHQHYASVLQEMDLKDQVQFIDLEQAKQSQARAIHTSS